VFLQNTAHPGFAITRDGHVLHHGFLVGNASELSIGALQGESIFHRG
jgi:hypothetical protein